MTDTPCDHPEGLRLTGYHRPEESQALIADMHCTVCDGVVEIRTDRTPAELDALMLEQAAADKEPDA